MPSLRSRLFVYLLKHRKERPAWDFNTSIPKFREECEKTTRLFGKLPKGIEVLPVTVENLRAEWLIPANEKKGKAILYMIGGGYVSGSCQDHRAIVARIAKGTNVRVLLFEHRLAPEDPFPAALDDSITAYRWLLKEGYAPADILCMGESAGGGLCLSLLLALKDKSIPLPAAAVALSPWTDLKLTGDSYRTKAETCLAPKGMSAVCSKYYYGENDPCMPWISPLYGELAGLPPLLITAGGDETMLDDSTRFAEKAKKSGVEVTLRVGEGMMHCYPLLPAFIPEARDAMNEICAFIQTKLAN